MLAALVVVSGMGSWTVGENSAGYWFLATSSQVVGGLLGVTAALWLGARPAASAAASLTSVATAPPRQTVTDAASGSRSIGVIGVAMAGVVLTVACRASAPTEPSASGLPTLPSSRRPLKRGRLGDSAAVTALLDRLLHHAPALKCRPKSWRTKVGTDLWTEGQRHWHEDRSVLVDAGPRGRPRTPLAVRWRTLG